MRPLTDPSLRSPLSSTSLSATQRATLSTVASEVEQRLPFHNVTMILARGGPCHHHGGGGEAADGAAAREDGSNGVGHSVNRVNSSGSNNNDGSSSTSSGAVAEFQVTKERAMLTRYCPFPCLHATFNYEKYNNFVGDGNDEDEETARDDDNSSRSSPSSSSQLTSSTTASRCIIPLIMGSSVSDTEPSTTIDYDLVTRLRLLAHHQEEEQQHYGGDMKVLLALTDITGNTTFANVSVIL